MLDLEPHLDCTLLRSTFLCTIWTCAEDKTGREEQNKTKRTFEFGGTHVTLNSPPSLRAVFLSSHASQYKPLIWPHLRVSCHGHLFHNTKRPVSVSWDHHSVHDNRHSLVDRTETLCSFSRGFLSPYILQHNYAPFIRNWWFYLNAFSVCKKNIQSSISLDTQR